MVYTLISNKELVEEMGNILVGGASCRLPAQQGWHAIMGKFLLVANPGYVVYNINGLIILARFVEKLVKLWVFSTDNFMVNVTQDLF